MSRVQLALNVSDIDEAVEFYSKLFGTEPAKRQPGYANFAIADPPLKLVLMEDPAARGNGVAGRAEPPRRRGRDDRRGGFGNQPPERHGDRDRGPRADHLLLRRPGQGVGERPRRGALGGLRRPGRRPGGDRHRRRRIVLCPRVGRRRVRERGRDRCLLVLLLSEGDIGGIPCAGHRLVAAAARRVLGQRLPRRHRHRFGDRRAEALARRRRAPALRERSSDRERGSSPSS